MSCGGPDCKDCHETNFGRDDNRHGTIRYPPVGVSQLSHSFDPDSIEDDLANTEVNLIGPYPPKQKPTRSSCDYGPLQNCLEPDVADVPRERPRGEPVHRFLVSQPVFCDTFEDRVLQRPPYENMLDTYQDRRASTINRKPSAPVVLHVYDLGKGSSMTVMNKMLRIFGTGAYHVAIEVYGEEWSFGYPGGVFNWPPAENDHHRYCEAIQLGMTALKPNEVKSLVEELEMFWPGDSYHIQRCNCTHFCEEFSKRLGAGSLPFWVKSLSAPKKRPTISF